MREAGAMTPSELLAALDLAPLAFVAPSEALPRRGGALVLVDRDGALPRVDPAQFDALVTTAPAAPAPWIAVAPARLDAQLRAVEAMAARSPVATTILARLLRMAEGLPFGTVLEIESLAYSALLGGAEFARWRGSARPGEDVPTLPGPVHYDREGDHVTLTLASPANRNAMTARMRDALCEALAAVLDDPSRPTVTLAAQGRAFSTGGHLPEFGTARDLAAAHLVRTGRSPAALLHRLGARASVHVHGAAIGSGIEIAASAARRTAAPGAFAQLPELAMGLIPGAGGTVTLARAIGRHRLLWLALGAFRIGAAQGREWGLFHEIAR